MRSVVPPPDGSSLQICVGCSETISGGPVVSFGDALFHLNWYVCDPLIETKTHSHYYSFACAKCHQLVDCQSNLLFLADGRPVCEDCSYVCKRCHQGIGQEAIMTGIVSLPRSYT
jgi:hypothetical protein